MSTQAEDTRAELAAEAERIIVEQTRLNEIRLALVQAVTISTIAALLLVQWVMALASGSEPPMLPVVVIMVTYSLISISLLMALRRGWNSRLLGFAAPVRDGILVAAIFSLLLQRYGPQEFARHGLPALLALASALVVMTGALRLRREATYAATAVGIAVFVLVARDLANFTLGIGAATLSGLGMISARMAEVVRNATHSQLGREILRRFLPSEVIERAHKDPLALLTEPRSVDATVVVTDLRGFTALSEHLPPIAVLRLLNEIQGAFAAVIREQGGTVDKFMGDGMLAVFGAPEPQADHASRAIAAAHDLRRALQRLNEPALREGRAPLRIGVGIHSGLVVTGCLGSGARLEFTVIGDTVNTASRLEGITKEKGVDVLLSAETVQRHGNNNGGAHSVTPLGKVMVRGRSEPLRVFTLR